MLELFQQIVINEVLEKTHRSNLKKEEHKTLKELKQDNTLIVKKAGPR